jgi:hypothetical protein
LSLLIILSFSENMRAQTTTSGGLARVVTDPSNALVPDANVEIRDKVVRILHEARSLNGAKSWLVALPDI